MCRLQSQVDTYGERDEFHVRSPDFAEKAVATTLADRRELVCHSLVESVVDRDESFSRVDPADIGGQRHNLHPVKVRDRDIICDYDGGSAFSNLAAD